MSNKQKLNLKYKNSTFNNNNTGSFYINLNNLNKSREYLANYFRQ